MRPCSDDVEQYFNYMGCLAVEGTYDRMYALLDGAHPRGQKPFTESSRHALRARCAGADARSILAARSKHPGD